MVEKMLKILLFCWYCCLIVGIAWEGTKFTVAVVVAAAATVLQNECCCCQKKKKAKVE